MKEVEICFAVVLLLGYLGNQALGQSCAKTPFSSYSKHSCGSYWKDQVEIYKDTMGNGMTSMDCCDKSDQEAVDDRTKRASSCYMTQCSTSTDKDHCPTRSIRGKAARPLDQILRERCTTKGNEAGYTSLCCPKNSLEGQLASVYGAEPNEFPHITKLLLPGHCGGTIYNKRWIITAAHCTVDPDTYRPNLESNMKAIIGSNSGDNKDARYVYQVEKAIPHEKYSRLHPNSDKMKDKILFDIALLKLEKDIEFVPNVKALQLAEPDFKPTDYADHTIIAGWGTTDTLQVSAHLQKANFLLRNPDNCFEMYNSTERGYRQAPHSEYKEYKDQLLCVGGILEGKWSPTAGGGDSGGPAVCRGPDGRALLCGVTSFGGNDTICLEKNNEKSCIPSIYARVSYFNDWIKKHAGEPADDKDIYKPFLYGEPVTKGRYDHQVHITSATGKSCGGTLVSQDVVITAATCIANDGGTGRSGVKVHYGLNDLKKGKAMKSYDVARVAIFDGFQLVGEKVDVTKQGRRIRITDDFYKNNLAAIKLIGKAPINDTELPELPGKGKMFEEGREIAFPRSTHHGGKLALRDFNILDKDECKKRMSRLAKGEDKMDGASVWAGEDILCGVEKYSGGSLCDRELGGGLICTGDNGEDVLCGVQIFRLCEWSIPNAFMDMGQKSHWVKSVIKQLK